MFLPLTWAFNLLLRPQREKEAFLNYFVVDHIACDRYDRVDLC